MNQPWLITSDWPLRAFDSNAAKNSPLRVAPLRAVAHKPAFMLDEESIPPTRARPAAGTCPPARAPGRPGRRCGPTSRLAAIAPIADHHYVNRADLQCVARRNQLLPRSTVGVHRVHDAGAVLDRGVWSVVEARACLLVTNRAEFCFCLLHDALLFCVMRRVRR